MAGTRVTVTLSESQMKQIRKIIKNWPDRTLAGFVRTSVAKTLENDLALRAMVEQSLMETGGPATPEERAWVKELLSPMNSAGGAKSARRRKAA